MSEASELMRKEWTANDSEKNKGLETPKDVQRFDDIQYGVDPVWNVLDVYRPKGKEGRLPVIVSVHGGGWVYGDKDLYQYYCMSLAQRGFAVVNFTYRLAPEIRFPAGLQDTNEVIAWMYENQETYGLDMDHVFMVGDSAGAHMAGLYAAICTNPAYAEKYTFRVLHGFVPLAVGLNCGAYVLSGDEATSVLSGDQDRQLVYEDLLQGHWTEKEVGMLNVTDQVTPDFPPTYLMTAVGDFCRPHAPLMEKALKDNGVQYVYKTYGSEEEPLYHVFHVTVQEPAGQKCNDDECSFFRTFLS